MNNGERSVSFFKRCAAIKNQLFAVELLHISEINTFDKARMMRYASQAYRYDIVSVINFLTNTIKKATPTVQHTHTHAHARNSILIGFYCVAHVYFPRRYGSKQTAQNVNKATLFRP